MEARKEDCITSTDPMTPLLLLAIAFAWPAAIARCAALSVQPRRPTAGYRVSSWPGRDADAPTRLFGIRKPSVALPNNNGDAPLVRNACSKEKASDRSRGVHYNEETSTPHCNMLHQSFALIATGRRLSFLAISVMLVGALLAASTGIVGATVVAMGLIALPTMPRCPAM